MSNPVLATLPKLTEPINTRAELAKKASVGERTLAKVQVIKETENNTPRRGGVLRDPGGCRHG
jgi:hypothetical protein